MPVALSVLVFGALGALTRYGVDLLIERHTAGAFPVSTFFINVTGCVLAGLAVGVLVDRLREPSWLGVGVVTGFLGAYTTFSTFAFETRDLLKGLIKSAFFGASIGLMGTFYGFRTEGGAEGVGKAATRAVVASCVLILTLDYVLANLLFRVEF